MKKEDLIIKWLDNNLNDDEQKAFEQLDASRSLKRLDEAARRFKAPHFDIDKNYQQLLQVKATNSTTSVSWKKVVMGIAALLALALFFNYTLLSSSKIEQLAKNGEQVEFILPDTSEVILNAGSKISYVGDDWSENRNLLLDGEAYFKVAKGEKFTVHTKNNNSITVLGTQFKVNSRGNFLEVVCYEGFVKVYHNGEEREISAGNAVQFIGDELSLLKTSSSEPTWIHSKSNFKSVPYLHVLSELERQYNIKINAPVSISNTVFTGSFSHENLETALQAITIPLNLSFNITGDTVTLK